MSIAHALTNVNIRLTFVVVLWGDQSTPSRRFPTDSRRFPSFSRLFPVSLPTDSQVLPAFSCYCQQQRGGTIS